MKEGTIVRVIREQFVSGSSSSFNEGAIARVLRFYRGNHEVVLSRVDGRPWRTIHNSASGSKDRAFDVSEVEPVDPGIAALYGYDVKEETKEPPS